MITDGKNLDITTGQDIHDFALSGLAQTTPGALAEEGVNTNPRPYEFYAQSAVKNAAQDAAWGWENNAYSPYEDIGVKGQNDSYYDQYIYSREDLEDLNEVRAREQGLLSKIGGGIGRNLTIATMGTVGNVVGTVAGVFTGADEASEAGPDESKWDKFWEGFWSNKVNSFVNDVINTANEAMPIYESASDQDASFLKRITSGNFWSNFIANMGWTESMIITTVLTGGMGVASMGSKIASLLGASKNAASWVYRIIGACTGSMAEASTEAINGYDEAKLDYVKLIDQQYQINKQALDEKVRNEFLAEKERLGLGQNPESQIKVNGLTAEEALLQNIQAKYAGDYQDLENSRNIQLSSVEKNATAAGTNIFGMNVFWLTLSNSLGVFSNITTPMTNINRVAKGSWKNIFNPKGQWQAASRKELLAREGIEAIAQGNEEMLQGGAAETAKAYYGQYYNPEFTGEMEDYLKVAYKQYANVYSDPKMWEEFMSGFFLGLTGVGGIGNKRVKGKDGYTNAIRPEWTGGIFKALSETKEEANRGQQIFEEANDYYNKYVNDKNLQARAKFVIGTLADKEAMAEAVDNDDKKKFLDEEGNMFIRMCETFTDIGRINDLKAMVGSETNMSDDEIKEFVAINSEEIKDENGVGTGKYTSNLPVVTSTGELMSGTPEGIEEVRKRLKKDQQKANTLINTYVDNLEQVDSSTGYGLTRDQLQVLTWMKMKGLLSEDRLNSMTANDLSKLLKGKLLTAWRTNRVFRSDNDDDSYIKELEKSAKKFQGILDTFNDLVSNETESENTYDPNEVKVLQSKLDKVNKALELAKRSKASEGEVEEEKMTPMKVIEKFLGEFENNLTEDKGSMIAALLRMPILERPDKDGNGTKTVYFADIIQELLEDSYGFTDTTMDANKIMNDMVRLHKDMMDYDRTFREYLAAPQKATDLLNDTIQTSNKARLKYKTNLMLNDLAKFTEGSQNLLPEDYKDQLNKHLEQKVNDELNGEDEANQNYLKEELRKNSIEYEDYFSNKETAEALKAALDTLDTQNEAATPNIGITKEFISKLGNTYNFLDYRYSTREELVNKALELGYTPEQAFEIVSNLRKATAVISAQQVLQQKIFEEAQRAAQEKGKNDTIEEEGDGEEYSSSFSVASLEDNLTEEDKELNKIFKSKENSEYFEKQLQKYAKEITGKENASVNDVLKVIYAFSECIFDVGKDPKEKVLKFYRKFTEAIADIASKYNKDETRIVNNQTVHKMVSTISEKELLNLKKKWLRDNAADSESAFKALLSYANYINALTCYLANGSKDGILDKSIINSEYGTILSDIIPMINDSYLGADSAIPAYVKTLDKNIPTVPADEGTEPLSLIDEDSVENTFANSNITYKPIPASIRIPDNKVIVGQTVYAIDSNGDLKVNVTLYKKSDIDDTTSKDDTDNEAEVILSNKEEAISKETSEKSEIREEKQKDNEILKESKKPRELEDYLDETDDIDDDVSETEQEAITKILGEDKQQGVTEKQSEAVAKLRNVTSEFDKHVFFEEDNHTYYIYFGDDVEQAQNDFKNKNYSNFTKATKSPSKLRYTNVTTTEEGKRTGNASRGRTIGDEVDLIVREYFKGSSKEDVAEKLIFFPKDSDKFSNVWDACGVIKSRIEQIYPDSIIYTDTYKLAAMYREQSGDTIIAGSPDMVVIDRDGVAHIFDMKALAENQLLSPDYKAEHPNGTNSYEMYQVQTLAYANMLNANGVPTDVTTANLIQFSTENNTVKLLDDFATMSKDDTSDIYTNPIQNISFSNYSKPKTDLSAALSVSEAEVLNEDIPNNDITPTENEAVSEEEQKILDTNTSEETVDTIEFNSDTVKKKVGNTEQLGFMVTDYLEYDWKSEQEGEYVEQLKGKAICQFLKDSGVYDFLNSGKLKKNARIYCREITGDLMQYYGDLYSDNLSKVPRIDAVIGLFVIHNGKMQCIGAIDIDSDSIGGRGSYTGNIDTAHNIRNNISIAAAPESRWISRENDERRRIGVEGRELGVTGKVISNGNVIDINLKATVDKTVAYDTTSDSFLNTDYKGNHVEYVSLKNDNGQVLSVAGILPGRIQVKPKKDSKNDLVPVRTIDVGRKSFDEAFKDGDVYIGSTFSVDKKIVAVNSKGENVMIEGLNVPFDTGATIIIYRGGDGKWRCSAALGRTITYANAQSKTDNAIINKIKWAVNAKSKRGLRGIAALMAAQSNILKTDSPFRISNLTSKVEKNALNIFKHLNLQPKEVKYESSTNTLTITLKDGTNEIIKGNNKTKEAIEKEVFALLEKYKARFSMSQAIYLNQNNSVSSKSKAKMINSLVDLSVSNIENFSTRNTRVALSYAAELTPTVTNPEHTKSSNYTEVIFGELALRKKDDNTFVLTTGKHQLTANEVATLFQLKLNEAEKPNLALLINDLLSKLYNVLDSNTEITEDLNDSNRDVYNGVMKLTGVKNKYKQVLFDLTTRKALPRKTTLKQVQTSGWRNAKTEVEIPSLFSEPSNDNISNSVSLGAISTESAESTPNNVLPEIDEVQAAAVRVKDKIEEVKQEVTSEEASDLDVSNADFDLFNDLMENAASETSEFNPNELPVITTINEDSLNLNEGTYNIHEFIDKFLPKSDLTKLLKKVISKKATLKVQDAKEFAASYDYRTDKDHKVGGITRYGNSIIIPSDVTVESVIHELCHYTIPDITLDKEAYANIKRTYEVYKAYTNSHYTAEEQDRLGIGYATTNVVEFMSELLSTNSVAKLLNSIPFDYMYKDNTGEWVVNDKYRNNETGNVNIEAVERAAKKESLLRKILNAFIRFFKKVASVKEPNVNWYTIAKKAGMELINSFTDNAENTFAENFKKKIETGYSYPTLQDIYTKNGISAIMPIKPFEHLCAMINSDIFDGTYLLSDAVSDISRAYSIEYGAVMNLALRLIEYVNKTKMPLGIVVDMTKSTVNVKDLVVDTKSIDNEAQFNTATTFSLAKTLDFPLHIKDGIISIGETSISKHTLYPDIIIKLKTILLNKLSDRLSNEVKKFIDIAINNANSYYEGTKVALPKDIKGLINTLLGSDYEKALYTAKALSSIPYNSDNMLNHILHLINNALQANNTSTQELSKSFGLIKEKIKSIEYDDINDVVRQKELNKQNLEIFNKTIKEIVKAFNSSVSNDVITLITNVYKNGHLGKILDAFAYKDNRRNVLSEVMSTIIRDNEMVYTFIDGVIDDVEDGLFGYPVPSFVQQFLDTYNILSNINNRMILRQFDTSVEKEFDNSNKMPTFAEQIDYCKI